MSAWQQLPDELPPEVQHFVEQLRLLKDRTGLSLVALGARTAYSKSSWQRYLNGTQPPPRQAVVALCRVAQEDAERFGVRWELAVRAWPRSAPQTMPPSRPPHPVRAGAGERAGAEAHSEAYEDDPTLPWWDTPAGESNPRPPGRIALYAALAVLTALALVGAALTGVGTLL
ncbi:helix-turn-helix domain-containing protein [Streptomyces europaeiscabiei]|uniref:Helix-turn-helix transcriptional regulator n=1 Tax=Streptomyces europaeiscabiei TaxID=146819 RepID=A0ABU4NGY3_9ACTN|nr:helix-turn-helix transcriptional regulator [Streptomyces europaeiscabiei]MDX3543040.1 helix-turn-helix transcriptional regulator [Streptomyces europaeiscabiei]MDX3552856.1 helix-turn-helix transcriptional regulator [Streptomyces europaeiscabiei]MDX3667580.1 helix-turn-helix transcriptional regulator [Streptomyces europaeiscabiei]MDX3700700.1 helix-turn-helix transcriptional regulator [Streptomyces europaeiscabiei]MDX3708582.1 helix-turn-helix transcriptional regulator [Streptomyces europaei